MIEQNYKKNPQKESVQLDFRNITYKVSLGLFKDEKIILDNISGRFPSGKLIGILGPSGAGKTTLLNVLSGYENEKLQGKIYINGDERNMKRFKKMSCYITQDNDLQELLTVQENMLYTADFKLGGEVSQEEKDYEIYNILKSFGLLDIRDTRTKQISGGQMKRLSIALELLNNPNIMFLDEPTTGLDSMSSYQCIKYLKKLADQGRTIICTIHQPSSSMLKLFGQVYVLSKGKCLYSGDTSQIVPFMAKVDFPCPEHHNPADYIIELANKDHGAYVVNLMIKTCENGADHSLISQSKVMDNSNNTHIQKASNIAKDSEYKSNIYELKTLIRRDYIKVKRDPFMTHLRLLASVTNSVAISCLFWKMGSDSSKIWFNYNLILAFITNLIVGGLMVTILSLPLELATLKKEHFNGYYSLKNYFFTITLSDIPISITYGVVSNLIVYYLTDQPLETHRIAKFTGIGFLITIVAQTLGLFLGSFFNLHNSIFIASYIHFPIMLFSGFGLTIRDIPGYLRWFSHVSYLRYGVEGMTGAVYGYNRSKLPCPTDDYCHYSYGEKFMYDMGVEGNRFWFDVMVLIVIYVLLRGSSYLAMRSRVKQSN